MGKILDEDIQIAADQVPAAELQGKKVFVTGSTGLIGSQICKSLLVCNRKHDTGITVIAMVRNEEKAKSVFSDFLGDSHLIFYKGDITAPVAYAGDVDYIIHGASPTASKYFVEHPVETIQVALQGSNSVLEFARDKKVQGMVYLSSLEVYGVPDGSRDTITEKDYGYLDPMSVRSSYSEGKRIVETLCVSYASEYNVPVKVVRLSQTFGAGVQYNDGRVFAEFARCLIEKKDIILHTEGKTVRTYCYTRDAVSAILTVLTKGTPGEAYNVTNRDTACSIKEMAELVASLEPEAGVQVRVEIPENLASFGYNPTMIIRLDPGKLEALGWKPTVGIEEMFRRLIASMRERG